MAPRQMTLRSDTLIAPRSTSRESSEEIQPPPGRILREKRKRQQAIAQHESSSRLYTSDTVSDIIYEPKRHKKNKDVAAELAQCRRENGNLTARNAKAEKQIEQLKQQLASATSLSRNDVRDNTFKLGTELVGAKAESANQVNEMPKLKVQLDARKEELALTSDKSVSFELLCIRELEAYSKKYDELKGHWVSLREDLERLERTASQCSDLALELHLSDECRCCILKEILNNIQKEVLSEGNFDRDINILAYCVQARLQLDKGRF